MITAALMRSLWQDAIVAFALWIVLRASRRRSPNFRYLVGGIALAAMVLWPVLGSVSVRVPVSSQTTSALASPNSAPAVVPEIVRSGWTLVVRAQATSAVPFQQWVLPFWIAGVMLFSLRAIGSSAHARRVAKRGAPADSGLTAIVTTIATRVGVTRRVRVLTSALSQGPATIGALRPLILIPPAALTGLTPQQLEAIIAHELAHIRRHDYLLNLIQVLVETLLFYHPAIWWASNRIRIERELCCDDVAVRCCGDRLEYAQALTTLARLPLASPRLAPGASSGPLVQRIHRLLGEDARGFAPSLWPPAVAVVFVLACAAFNMGWAQTAGVQRFEVASVKQNRSGDLGLGFDLPGTRRFTATNVPLRDLIRFAFDVDDTRLVGGPDWIKSDRFDIVATSDQDIPTWTPAGPPSMLLSMLRSLLKERFQLATRTETRELPVYALVMARTDRTLGPRASVSTVDCAAMLSGRSGPQPPPASPSDPPQCGMRIGPGQMLLGGVPMSQFATVLAQFARRLVVNRTELAGNFNLQLSWTPQAMRLGGPPPPDGAAPAPVPPPLPPPDPNGASLFVSIQEQLGLKLEPSRAPVDVVVIDHVERPTPD
jgi:uncharacterized protein (TIGR03435 family)